MSGRGSGPGRPGGSRGAPVGVFPRRPPSPGRRLLSAASPQGEAIPAWRPRPAVRRPAVSFPAPQAVVDPHPAPDTLLDRVLNREVWP